MKNRTKMLTALAVLLSIAVLVSVPIIPVKAEVISGETQVPESMQKILLYGNYSLNFELQDFEATLSGLNVTAETFTVTAYTNTQGNTTTGYITINLEDVDAVVFTEGNTYPLHVGKATLNIDLYMEGSYIKYSFYADTTSSIFEIAENAINALT